MSSMVGLGRKLRITKRAGRDWERIVGNLCSSAFNYSKFRLAPAAKIHGNYQMSMQDHEARCRH